MLINVTVNGYLACKVAAASVWARGRLQYYTVANRGKMSHTPGVRRIPNSSAVTFVKSPLAPAERCRPRPKCAVTTHRYSTYADTAHRHSIDTAKCPPVRGYNEQIQHIHSHSHVAPLRGLQRTDTAH